MNNFEKYAYLLSEERTISTVSLSQHEDWKQGGGQPGSVTKSIYQNQNNKTKSCGFTWGYGCLLTSQ